MLRKESNPKWRKLKNVRETNNKTGCGKKPRLHKKNKKRLKKDTRRVPRVFERLLKGSCNLLQRTLTKNCNRQTLLKMTLSMTKNMILNMMIV